MMGVIFEVGDDTGELLIPFIQKRKPEHCADHIYQLYLKASLGEITGREFWYTLGFGNEYPEIELEYLDTKLTLDPGFIPVAEQLASHYSLAILSNDIGPWSAYLRQKYGLNRLFNAVIISSEVGYRKPDHKIYQILLDRIQVPASACVYIDDRLKNLHPAGILGFKTIRFNRAPDTHQFTPDFQIDRFDELPAIIKQMT